MHHASLLENFESGLQALGEVSLHPAIRAAIEEYSMSASTAVSGMQTAVGVAAAGVSNVATPGEYICCIPYNSTSRLVFFVVSVQVRQCQ